MQVLNIINFAEAKFLGDNPSLASAQVVVHLSSHVEVRMPAGGVVGCVLLSLHKRVSSSSDNEPLCMSSEVSHLILLHLNSWTLIVQLSNTPHVL